MPAVRLTRGLAMAVLAALIVVSVATAAHSLVPGTPRPPHLPAVRAASLHARYEANRRYILSSERAAWRLGDTGRADVLRQLARSDRHFLSFSPDGDGQAVEVLGDLARAEVISVIVPGSDTTLDTFDQLGTRYASLGGSARAVYARERQLAPDRRVAVVAWYGYHAPRTMSFDIATTDRAKQGALRLRKLLVTLRGVSPAARVTLLCHSYGSVVCGQTLRGVDKGAAAAPSAVVVFGSPGMGVRSRAGLRSNIPLWAGRGTRDWITRVPNDSVDVMGQQVGFGTDPTSPSFGARHFPTGSAEHSDYLRPGGVALKNICLIALGRGSVVSGD